jgi:hypothetical protein
MGDGGGQRPIEPRPGGGAHPSGRAAEGTPRWVWVSGALVLAILLVVVVVHLTGGGMRMHG